MVPLSTPPIADMRQKLSMCSGVVCSRFSTRSAGRNASADTFLPRTSRKDWALAFLSPDRLASTK